jgi:hypothetical protein
MWKLGVMPAAEGDNKMQYAQQAAAPWLLGYDNDTHAVQVADRHYSQTVDSICCDGGHWP